MDWTTQKILDHGFIHLVDSMPHWSNTGHWASLGPGDARVVQAARVSMGHLPNEVLEELGLLLADEDDRTPEHDVRLINYLMKNRHTTPFEQVRFTFVVKLPIFVARQWIRHRTGSFNEMSARYTKLPQEFYIPALDRMQAQAQSNKQASGELLDPMQQHDCRNLIQAASERAYFDYEELLKRGLSRELARVVLPTNIYTQWYWTSDLHNLLGFLKLRAHSHAQYEIRVYADAILAMIERIAPVSVAAFQKHVIDADQRQALEARAVKAEGKLAALIEWTANKRVHNKKITPELLAAAIESLFEQDAATG